MFYKIFNKLVACIPEKKVILQKRSLKWLHPFLKNKKLWIYKRKSIANALFIGIFCAFTPWPLQMVQAVVMSVWFSANVSIAIALVWITNPLTIGPMFYGTYKLGAWLIGFEANFPEFELSFFWLVTASNQIWLPLLFGSAITGIVGGMTLWFLCHALWHRNIMKKWQQSRALQLNKK